MTLVELLFDMDIVRFREKKKRGIERVVWLLKNGREWAVDGIIINANANINIINEAKNIHFVDFRL